MVRIVCFEHMKGDRCAEVFPGTTGNQRYQWKRRGLTLLWPHASELLRRFLR